MIGAGLSMLIPPIHHLRVVQLAFFFLAIRNISHCEIHRLCINLLNGVFCQFHQTHVASFCSFVCENPLLMRDTGLFDRICSKKVITFAFVFRQPALHAFFDNIWCKIAVLYIELRRQWAARLIRLLRTNTVRIKIPTQENFSPLQSFNRCLFPHAQLL